MSATQNRAMVAKRIEDGNVRAKLKEMVLNPGLNTTATSYSSNAELYPDGQMPFVEKHLAYLINHPNVDPEQYLSNLRLMLKKRG